MKKKKSSSKYVICVKNKSYQASLELRKIYRTLPDPKAAALHLIRVIDESGEDYLYPSSYFVPVTLPRVTERALAQAS